MPEPPTLRQYQTEGVAEVRAAFARWVRYAVQEAAEKRAARGVAA
jgi:hypothetical protein